QAHASSADRIAQSSLFDHFPSSPRFRLQQKCNISRICPAPPNLIPASSSTWLTNTRFEGGRSVCLATQEGWNVQIFHVFFGHRCRLRDFTSREGCRLLITHYCGPIQITISDGCWFHRRLLLLNDFKGSLLNLG